MLPGKLPDVTVQVLRADLMEGAFMSPLQDGPKGFDPVSMSHTPDILPNGVLNGLPIRAC